MTAYIARRLLLMIPTLFGIILLNFLIVQVAPGGPVEQMVAKLQGLNVSATDRFSGGGQEAGAAQLMQQQLGAERIVWLGNGLVEDADTDGHVDNVCAFLAPGRVLLQTVRDPDDPDHDDARRNREILDRAGLDVVELDLLPRTVRDDGGTVAIPYTNFYLCNGGLVAPCFDDPHDGRARDTLAQAFPDRDIMMVPALDIVAGGGGIHCITQQEPR